jgi:uncharacterized protein YfeS
VRNAGVNGSHPSYKTYPTKIYNTRKYDEYRPFEKAVEKEP